MYIHYMFEQILRENFKKMVQFGACWCIYFDQMFLKIISKIVIFI